MTDRRGFSLIEMVVVIIIIGIMGTFALPNLYGFYNHWQLDRFSDKVYSSLRSAGLKAREDAHVRVSVDLDANEIRFERCTNWEIDDCPEDDDSVWEDIPDLPPIRADGENYVESLTYEGQSPVRSGRTNFVITKQGEIRPGTNSLPAIHLSTENFFDEDAGGKPYSSQRCRFRTVLIVGVNAQVEQFDYGRHHGGNPFEDDEASCAS